MQTRAAALFITTVLLLGMAAGAMAQTELFSSAHLFALPMSTTTRLYGMGGFISCVQDRGFANPAFAGLVEDIDVVGRYSVSGFDNGLDLRGGQLSVTIPLKPGTRGLQLTGFSLSADPGVLALPGAPPAQVDFSETDVAIHYGQRVGNRYLVGVGFSPLFNTSASLTEPISGTPLMELDASVDKGVRLGFLAELKDGCLLGVVYDRYDEDVTGHFLGAPVDESFSSEVYIAGLSYRLDKRCLAAVEWQDVSTERGGISYGDAGMRFGMECAVSRGLALRSGYNDGAWSAGAGYVNDAWSIQYAYVNDLNADSVGPFFGDSETHQFELTHRW